jgi:hypothetical protein
MPLPDPRVKCPATGFARSCRKIIAECDCPKFVSIKGQDPQTGAIVDREGCVDSFLPLLLIEGAQMSRQTGAAVESLRNEIIRANDEAKAKLRSLLQSEQGARLLQSPGSGER